MEPPADPNYINNNWLVKNKVLKRQYQVAIFVTCSRTNCLVVVPTGLGKTMIALLLAVHRISKNPDSKVIFLAPTKPLVDQHLRTFQDLTVLDKEHLILMTGSVPPAKREQLYKEATVLFMTPQVLQNDLISNRVSLQNVSLIIFDEAHRATGDYSYVFLAKKYAQQAKDLKILAMTASPGKNREKIEEVMQNLGLNAVEIRTEDDPDVKPYIQKVDMIWKEVELPPELLEIIKTFELLVAPIYQALGEQGFLENENASEVSRRELLAAGKQIDYQVSQGQQQDIPRLLFMKKAISNAIRISHMTELVEAQGIPALKAFIDKSIEEIEAQKAGKSLVELFRSPEMMHVHELVDTLVSKQIDHPKMAVLMALVQDQFKDNPQSRILIFCHFRDSVDMITELLNKSELIRAERFVGQQTKGSDKGLSQKQQIELLQRFKSGELNSLVATSVAEEGLDISECDVVIFYDVVPSEIRSIQRRGRTGRNRAGKVILLKTKGTREEAYFWAEKHREKEMKSVLKELRKDLSTKYAKTSEIVAPGQKSMTAFMQKPAEDRNSDRSDPKSSKDSPQQESSKDTINSLLTTPSESIRDTEKHTTTKVPIPWDPSPEKMADKDVYIMVDSRETASPVARELSTRNVAIDLAPLIVGDYIVSERVGIERKAIPDLVSSIKDGRLFDELLRLRNQFSVPILILEGDIHNIGGVHPAAVLGAISSIMLNMNIFIYQTATPSDTAAILVALAKKEQVGNNSHKFSIRFKKVPNRMDRQLEYIIAGIPGINVARAQDLLQQFETIQNIFNATPDQLKQTPNIGPVLAKNINEFATMKYKPEKRDHSEEEI